MCFGNSLIWRAAGVRLACDVRESVPLWLSRIANAPLTHDPNEQTRHGAHDGSTRYKRRQC